ncbi:MAG: PPC domain-containing DNA-binding protein [Candidatus Eisenbacteria bacterium]
MEYRDSDNIIFVRLHQGDDLFDSLRGVAGKCGLRVGVVVSGIGMLKQAELAYFVSSGRYAPVLFPEPLELVSLTGNIIFQDDEYHMHLHAVLADEEKQTVAGHLSNGKVNVTNEIVILKTSVRARRALDEKTGLMALTFE